MLYEIECSVEGCTKQSVRKVDPLCGAHYSRLRRYGSVGDVEVSDRVRKVCSVDGCDRLNFGHGLCQRHLRHQQKGGVGAIGHSGAENGVWTETPGYAAAHERIYRARGKAVEQTCTSCGRPAQHWAYDHLDPNELRTEAGITYSGDPQHYRPMCVPCHKTFDIRAAERE